MPHNIKCAIEKLEELMFPKPSLDMIKLVHGDINRKLEESRANIYLSKEIDVYLNRKKTNQENKSKLFTMIIGQCTDLVISKLESKNNWTKTEATNDVVELLNMIKDIPHKYKTQSYPFKDVHNMMKGFYLLNQKDTYTLDQYIESFLDNIDVIKHSNENIREYPKLGQYICKLDGDEDLVDATVVNLFLEQPTEAYFASAFILGANQK
eukprot:8881364-Ditylum_brightwellii.AAC.1